MKKSFIIQASILFFSLAANAQSDKKVLTVADYDQAIRLKPDFPQAYSDRGVTHYLGGNHDKAVRDYDNYPKTMPYVEDGKVLSREGGDKGDKVTVLYSKINTPLVDRRDYIIRLVDESAWQEGKGFMKVTWTVVNDMDEKVPVPKDVVRVRINEGYWLLEPREEGKKTFATYYVYTSPGGALPNFIINKANTIAVPKVFESIKKTVSKK